jgi:GNAT superfamily N-acetyltransferase
VTAQRDREWLTDLWTREWGGTTMITCGRTHHLDDLNALIAWIGDEPVGAATWSETELLSLNALNEGKGIGTALLTTVEDAVRAAGKDHLWLVTTNDNLDALRFYQRRGYRLTELRPGAVDAARKLKPAIPLIGYHGIPLHDELILSKPL